MSLCVCVCVCVCGYLVILYLCALPITAATDSALSESPAAAGKDTLAPPLPDIRPPFEESATSLAPLQTGLGAKAIAPESGSPDPTTAEDMLEAI